MLLIRSFIVSFFLAVLTGCSFSPPLPPEPEGPLVKINANQPHEKYEEK